MAATQRRPKGSVPPHGTVARYVHGSCRCDACRRERRRYETRLAMGYSVKVPSHPTVRRLQALAVIGWSLRDLEAETGIDRSTIRLWRNGRWATLSRVGAGQIADLYARLWRTPGPSAEARAHAQRNDWLPPHPALLPKGE